MNEICIIYCPTHKAFTSPKKRWMKIADALAAHNVSYDVIYSEERQSVEKLVTKAVNDGYKTLVIAGGDSALNDAVNSLMRMEIHQRDNVMLGVIPNGIMNDFAAYWGLTYNNVEKSIRSIVERRIRRVDAGCLRYKNKEGEKKQRYFIDCVNVGLLASIQGLKQKTRRVLWSRKVSFTVSLLLTIFHRLTFKMRYKINETDETHRVTTLCIGSAWGYGQTPNATPYSGMLDVTVVRSTLLMQHIEAIFFFLIGRLLNSKRILPYRTRSIRILSDKRLPVTVDGHPLNEQIRTMTVDIEPEVINFIIEESEKSKKSQ